MRKSIYMAHIHEETSLTPEERGYRECITRGDDFCRIELYRNAVEWYRKAVDMRPDSEEARLRLQDCRSRIKDESKKILVILGIAAALIALSVLIF